MARGLAKLQEDSLELEASAGTILNFQTAASRACCSSRSMPEDVRDRAPGHRADIAAAVTARMNRRPSSTEDRRPGVRHDRGRGPLAAAGRSLMRAQIQKIIDACGLGNMTIGIIPLSPGGVSHDHGFNILSGRGDASDPVVHVGP